MEALLIKNDEWGYVNGTLKLPSGVQGDDSSLRAVEAWRKADSKAKSDIILSISTSELKQIKGCMTSRDVWLKLERIYQSKGPARKANLLKQLTLQRMEEGTDVSLLTVATFSASAGQSKRRWCIDSGATSHLCKNIDETMSARI